MSGPNPDLIRLYVEFERREAKATAAARTAKRAGRHGAKQYSEGMAAAYGAARVRVQLALDMDAYSIRTEHRLLEEAEGGTDGA